MKMKILLKKNGCEVEGFHYVEEEDVFPFVRKQVQNYHLEGYELEIIDIDHNFLYYKDL